MKRLDLKRIISVIVAQAVLLGALPLRAFAGAEDYEINTAAELIAAAQTGGEVFLANNIDMTFSSLKIENNLVLDLNGKELKVISTDDNGITIESGKSLTIKSNNPAGRLYANSLTGAGINATNGTLIIESGEITAIGGAGGAGIGGAVTVSYVDSEGNATETSLDDVQGASPTSITEVKTGGDGGRVIINGGVVNATGGSGAAGIGGGDGGRGGSITITGGLVNAEGNGGACDIGSGNGGSADSTVISGGSVFATNKNIDGFSGTFYPVEVSVVDKYGAILSGASITCNVTYTEPMNISGSAVCLWLPAGNVSITATADGKKENTEIYPVIGDYNDTVSVTLLSPEEKLIDDMAKGVNCDLDADYTIITEIIINNSLTLDLNGKNLVVDLSEGTGSGIKINGGATLTIKDGLGGGSLTATSDDGAGISTTDGTLIIDSGNITATGGNNAAGIGGEALCSGGNVIINGGFVKAAGGNNGAGIGGGAVGNGGNITITGGSVNAKGENGADDIGAGIGGGEGTTAITGGSVFAVNGKISGASFYPVKVITLDGNDEEVNSVAINCDGYITQTGKNLTSAFEDGVFDKGVAWLWLPVGDCEITADMPPYQKSVAHTVSSTEPNELIIPMLSYEDKLRKAAADGGTYSLSCDFDGEGTNEPIIGTELVVENSLILDLNGKNLVIDVAADNGIKINSGATLTIKDEVGSGVLTVKSSDGSGINTTSGSLIIKSGTITATGGNNSAGIGGRMGATGGVIEINGGIVNAEGGRNAAGIGGGYEGAGGTITITGSTVNALGGRDSAGIGGGAVGAGGNITISGGIVNAKGQGGANDIGMGDEGTAGTVAITGGSVFAVNGKTDNSALYPVKILVVDDSGSPVDGANVSGVNGFVVTTGVNDTALYPENVGAAWLWLATGSYDVTASKDTLVDTVSFTAGTDFEVELMLAESASTMTAVPQKTNPKVGESNEITFTILNSGGFSDKTINGSIDITISGVEQAVAGTYGKFGTVDINSGSAVASVVFTNGVGTVDLELHHAAEQTLSFSIDSPASLTVDNVVITPEFEEDLSTAVIDVVTQPDAGEVNGAKLITQPVITVTDRFGNPYLGSLTITATAKNDAWIIGGDTETTTMSGTAAFTNLTARYNGGIMNDAVMVFTLDNDTDTRTSESTLFTINAFSFGDIVPRIILQSEIVKVGAVLKVEIDEESLPAGLINPVYTWKADGTDTRVDAKKHTIKPADAGKVITVTLTADNYKDETVSLPTIAVPFTVRVETSGAVDGDDIYFGESGTTEVYVQRNQTVQISYALADTGTKTNRVTFSIGDETVIDSTDMAGSGMFGYKVLKKDATKGVVTITATFEHVNKEPEQTPDVQISIRDEKLTGLVPNSLYRINGSEVASDENGKIDILPVWVGESLLIIKVGDDINTIDSASQELPIPSRPERVLEGVTGGIMSISGVTTEMEYRHKDGTIWTSCDGTTVTVPSDGTYFIRYKATETDFASKAESVFVKPIPPEFGDIKPTISYDGVLKIGTELTAGIDTSALPEVMENPVYTWQANGLEVGEGLTYVITGANAGKTITVTLSTDNYGHATESLATDIIPYTVKLIKTGNINGDDVYFAADSTNEIYVLEDEVISIGYSLSNDGTKSNGITLSVGDTELPASADGDSFEYTVDENDVINGEITITAAFRHIYRTAENTPEIAIDYSAERLSGFAENSVYLINGVEFTIADGVMVDILPDWFGKELTIIKKGDNVDTENSASQNLRVPLRPTLKPPLTVVGGVECISGVTIEMEYKSSNSAKWISCGGIIITGLSAGDYEVRYKATDNAFAGAAVGVIVRPHVMPTEPPVTEPPVTEPPVTTTPTIIFPPVHEPATTTETVADDSDGEHIDDDDEEAEYEKTAETSQSSGGISDGEREQSGKINSEVRADETSPETLLVDSVGKLLGIVFTAEESARIRNGENANVFLSVSDIEEVIDNSDINKIYGAIGYYELGLCLDISLFKQIGDSDAVSISVLKDKINIGITVPDYLRADGRIYKVVRLHDGKVDILDGEYNPETGIFTFMSDLFSVYALIYTDINTENDFDKNPNTGLGMTLPTALVTSTTICIVTKNRKHKIKLV